MADHRERDPGEPLGVERGAGQRGRDAGLLLLDECAEVVGGAGLGRCAISRAGG